MNDLEHRQWSSESVAAVACSIALLGLGNAAAAESWRNLSPMPQGVQEIYAIFAIGGADKPGAGAVDTSTAWSPGD